MFHQINIMYISRIKNWWYSFSILHCWLFSKIKPYL